VPTPAPAPSAAAPAPAQEPASATGSIWPDTLESEATPTGHARHLRGAGGVRGALDRTALVGLALAAVALVLVLLGLSLDFGGESLWSTIPLWSAFATLCAALGLLAFAALYPAGNRLRSGPAWRVAAGGLLGLAVFWLLVVLPNADTDRGFLFTAALGCLGGALWIGPRARS
jgi:hypothetical protein